MKPSQKAGDVGKAVAKNTIELRKLQLISLTGKRYN